MENIFELTSRPDTNLLYKRNDSEDVRLGEIVRTGISDYYESNVVLLGSPQDEGVKRNKGREGAKDAPDKIRESLYKLAVNEKLFSVKIFDIGNVKTEKNLEEIHESQEEIVSRILKDGKKAVILGGGNDISYPDCKSLSKFNDDPLVINIDSHFDVRNDKPRNSGTSYRMLLDEKLIKPKNFIEFGIKKYASSLNHKNYLEEKGSMIFYLEEVKKKGIKKILKEILTAKSNKSLFWGFDMDVVKSSDAPGVSAPNPTGFSADDALLTAEMAGREKRTKIFEISEVNPIYDIDNKTSRLAAVMIWNFLNALM